MENDTAKTINEIAGSLYVFQILLFCAGVYLILQSANVILTVVGSAITLFAMIMTLRQQKANNGVTK